MHMSKITLRLYWAAEAMVLLGAWGASALTWRNADWHPLALVAVLFALSLFGQRLNVKIGTGVMTAAHIALVLDMVLLGPAPAVTCGVCAAVLTSGTRRVPRAVAQQPAHLLAVPARRRAHRPQRPRRRPRPR